MTHRVVSTKLTEEEHTALLDRCGREGTSPSAFVKNIVLEALNVERPQLSIVEERNERRKVSKGELELMKLLRINKTSALRKGERQSG